MQVFVLEFVFVFLVRWQYLCYDYERKCLESHVSLC